MLLFLLLSIFVLCLYRVKVIPIGFNDDYLSKDCTNSVKGLFILLVVLSHSLQYIKRSPYAFDEFGDIPFLFFLSSLSQLVVVMFLFYSGYGVGESFKSKGETYVNKMPRHRILGTLLNFDVAVIIFIALCVLLGISVSLRQCLLSFIGWESVGNSNWYIFVIILCYLMTFLCLRLPIENTTYRVGLLFGLCTMCIVFLSAFKDDYWYNTILCYPLGFLYSSYKDKVEVYLKRNYVKCALGIIICFILFYVLKHFLNDKLQLSYNLMSMAFVLMLIVVTFKVRVDNPPLRWIGSHLFPIYIYMRLPMIFMEENTPGLISATPALFIVISLVVTLCIAHVYRYFRIDL